jgi:hypothetical protein
MLKKFLLMTTGGIAVTILLILWEMWQTGNRLKSGIEAFLSAPQPTPVINSRNAIVRQIKETSELTTSVFVTETVVPTFQERKIGNVVLGTTKLLYIARGEVKAGINLRDLTAEAVKVRNDTIEIYLPAPTILDNKIDVDRSSVYHYDRGFLGLGPDVAPQLQTLTQRKTLEKIVASACREGILERANERAQLAITQILTASAKESIKVITTPPSSSTCKVISSKFKVRREVPPERLYFKNVVKNRCC